MLTYFVKIYRGLNNTKESWDNLVGVATGYDLDRLVSIPGRINIFLSPTMSRPAVGPTQPSI
jgi:hypothetical protein